MFARLRPIYNKIVMPIGQFSARMGFSPDFWTLTSLALAILSGYLLMRGYFWWGLVCSFLMYVADMLDGATARAAGLSSRFGTILDHVVDRYAEYIILSGLMLGGWVTPAGVMFATSGVVMASYVRAKAESAGGLSDCTVGIAGRAEKLLLTFGAIIALGLGANTIAEYLVWLVGLISHITAVQRLLYSRAQILRLGKSSQTPPSITGT
ncbi:MAG: CDP-alcohol phosphatidyltransferase family protein [Anaerolineales bacterium]|nr:CDP-alcohol phosphatidyltransferase family protein [Anaerolineales bacterium]